MQTVSTQGLTSTLAPSAVGLSTATVNPVPGPPSNPIRIPVQAAIPTQASPITSPEFAPLPVTEPLSPRRDPEQARQAPSIDAPAAQDVPVDLPTVQAGAPAPAPDQTDGDTLFPQPTAGSSPEAVFPSAVGTPSLAGTPELQPGDSPVESPDARDDNAAAEASERFPPTSLEAPSGAEYRPSIAPEDVVSEVSAK